MDNMIIIRPFRDGDWQALITLWKETG